MGSIASKIEKRFDEQEGTIFSINDFYDLGTKNTVKSVLYRLNKDKKIERLIDGLYVKPKYSKVLQEYSHSDAAAVAEKIAEKFNWVIAPTGETALNFTGLSTQVPNEYVYVSDGAYREYTYRDKKIIFKRTTNRNISRYSKEFVLLIQAIMALGQKNIKDEEMERLAIYSKRIKENLSTNTNKVPYWIKQVLEEIEKRRTNK